MFSSTPGRAVLLVAVVAALAGTAVAPVAATHQPAADEPTDGGSQDDGWDLEYTIFVTGDGEFERAILSLRVDDQSYQQLLDAAESDGYDTAAAWLAAQQIRDGPEFLGYDGTSDRQVANGYVLRIEFTQIDISRADDTTVTLDGDRLAVDIGNRTNPNTDPDYATVTYRLRMPGEIVSTNAISVNGQTATWRLHEEMQSTLAVTADIGGEATPTTAMPTTERPVSTPENSSTPTDTAEAPDSPDGGEEDEDDDATDSSGPGFGPVAALVALAAAALLARRSQ
jgi:PGF-CTERM protein